MEEGKKQEGKRGRRGDRREGEYLCLVRLLGDFSVTDEPQPRPEMEVMTLEHEKTVRVTFELIESGMTRRGGWKRAQLEILGETWPPQKGWKRRSFGRLISQADAARFVRLGMDRQGLLKF